MDGEKAKDGKEDKILDEPQETERAYNDNITILKMFFQSIIIACCFVLILPSTTSNTSVVLFCYFFITICIGGLFITYYKITEDSKKLPLLLYCGGTSAACIVITLIYTYITVSKYKKNVQEGKVTPYYYKFTSLNIWITLIECLLLFEMLYYINGNQENQNIPYIFLISIMCFCVLNFFVSWSNVIGLTNFTADG